MLCARVALLLAALAAAAPAPPPLHSPALASFLSAWTGAAPTAAAADAAAACAAALPADASIRLDASGLAPGAPPLPFLLRTLLDVHPGAAPLAACLVARGAAAPRLLAAHGGALLFAAASPRLLAAGAAALAAGAAAADPGALFRALLAAGVARNFTLGARDGFSVLHKLLSPDKRTVDDAATLLLQPQLQARDAARLAALAQGLAGAPGLPAAAAAAALAAGGSLLQQRLVYASSSSSSNSSGNSSSSSSAPLGRTTAAAHVHALWRAQSLVLLGALAAAPPAPQQPTLAQLAAQRDRFGRTPLHVAALGDCGAAVAALAGALAGALAPAAALRVLRGVDAAGYSPRALAVALGHGEAARALREAAAAAVAAAAAAGEQVLGHEEDEEGGGTAQRSTFLPSQLTPPAHPAASAHVATAAAAAAASQGIRSEEEEEEEDSGGWREPVHVSARARAAVAAALAGAPRGGGCQIAALPAADFTAALFVREYFLPARPVLVRGLLRAGGGWGGGGAPGSGARAWRAEEFLAAHGDLPVVAQGIPYAATFGEAAGAARSLREFAEELLQGGGGCSASVEANASQQLQQLQPAGACSPSSGAPAPYVFARLPPAGAAAPPAALRLGALLAPAPPFLARALLPTADARALPLLQPARAPGALSPELFLGGPGSGAPMHHHGDAFNALAHGRKAWYLLPPALAEYSSVPAAEFVLEVLPGLGGGARAPPLPLQCTQRAGDVLYVPRGWGHAVLNLNTSVGYAADFTTAMLRY